jgi:hypothetical protein
MRKECKESFKVRMEQAKRRKGGRREKERARMQEGGGSGGSYIKKVGVCKNYKYFVRLCTILFP